MKTGALAVLAVAVAVAGAAPAASGGLEEIAVGAGTFEVLDDTVTSEVNAELRFPSFLAFPTGSRRYTISPIAGAMTTADGALYAYGGFRLTLPVGQRWIVAPYTGGGLYDKGEGKDLGGPVEFRSGLEVSYRLNGRASLGLTFYHLSNAALYEFNPGSESLALVYSHRFGG